MNMRYSYLILVIKLTFLIISPAALPIFYISVEKLSGIWIVRWDNRIVGCFPPTLSPRSWSPNLMFLFILYCLKFTLILQGNKAQLRIFFNISSLLTIVLSDPLNVEKLLLFLVSNKYYTYLYELLAKGDFCCLFGNSFHWWCLFSSRCSIREINFYMM